MSKRRKPKMQRKGRSKQRQPAMAGAGECESCGTMLYLPGGYSKTGLCGPCATGEGSTASQAGETW